MDDEWRRAERAWRANPDDSQGVARAIASARRARVPIPYELLERQRVPARTFTSTRPFTVLVERDDGDEVEVGDTPGTVQVPECRTWWVRPRPAKATPQVVSEVLREEAPYLSLERSHVDAKGMAALAPLGERLHGLSLRSCTKLDAQALTHLERFPCLETLDLSGVKGVARDALERVARMTSLVHLGLERLKELKDDDVAPLADHPGLGRVSLVYCIKLSDKALDPLSRLPALVDLDLSSCKKLRDAALSKLVRASRRLRRLSLASCEKAGDGAMAALGELTDLRDLRLHLCRAVTATGIAALAGAPLERLDMVQVLSNARARALAPLAPTLLDLLAQDADDDDPLNDEGAGALASLVRLETLRLSGQRLTDVGVAKLAALGRLTTLDLSYMPLVGPGLHALRDLPLRTLHLFQQRALRADALAELPLTLEHLILTEGYPRGSLTDDTLAPLARLKRLRVLQLHGDAVTIATLKRLPTQELTTLGLSHSAAIDDAALDLLSSSFPRLERLDLGGCKKLTSAGVAHLVRAPALRWVRLSDGVVDDATRRALEARGCEVAG